MWMFHKRSSTKVNRAFRRLQLLSAAFLSLGHGTNDAQKTMGIITGLLVTAGFLKSFAVPIWVVLTCHFAIASGTFFGGWQIVKTMGQKITKLRPVDGFCAETAGGITLLIGTFLGIPISTTQTINGGIIGGRPTQAESSLSGAVGGGRQHCSCMDSYYSVVGIDRRRSLRSRAPKSSDSLRHSLIPEVHHRESHRRS